MQVVNDQIILKHATTTLSPREIKVSKHNYVDSIISNEKKEKHKMRIRT